MQIKIFAAILVALGGVVFAMQNNVPVTVNFLLWRFDSSLALVLLSSLALGAVIVALLTMPDTVRRQLRILRQKRRIDELENICAVQKRQLADAAHKQHAPDSAHKPADKPQ